ncbi:hypothetical protein [Halospeciosus flavus]
MEVSGVSTRQHVDFAPSESLHTGSTVRSPTSMVCLGTRSTGVRPADL